MNYYYIDIILLNILISNAIIVQETNELYKNIENQTFITNDDLNQLIRKYPGFIKLYLQENKYYTGSDASLCPLPYDETTLLDDPDVKKLQYFDPRECEKPWTWTQQNQIIVSVPKDFTINKKLGELVRQDSDLEILQKYTYYLNTIESVGITLADRFCLFLVEAIDRFDSFSKVLIIFKFANIREDYLKINLNIYNFILLFNSMYDTFKQYFISTLPLDCITNVLKTFPTNEEFKGGEGISILVKYIDPYRAQLLECRTLTNLKRNYAILLNDKLWKWDVTSKEKPNNNNLITLYFNCVLEGARLFNVDGFTMMSKR